MSGTHLRPVAGEVYQLQQFLLESSAGVGKPPLMFVTARNGRGRYSYRSTQVPPSEGTLTAYAFGNLPSGHEIAWSSGRVYGRRMAFPRTPEQSHTVLVRSSFVEASRDRRSYLTTPGTRRDLAWVTTEVISYMRSRYRNLQPALGLGPVEVLNLVNREASN